MTPVSFTASLFLLAGLWLIGNRSRRGFAFTFAGEMMWAALAADRGMWDLAAVCLVFAAVAVRNNIKWSRGHKGNA